MGFEPTVPFRVHALSRRVPSTARGVRSQYDEWSSRDLRARVALVFYLMRWMRADLDPKVVGPEQSQIVLLNKASVDREKAALREETVRLVREAGVARLEVD